MKEFHKKYDSLLHGVDESFFSKQIDISEYREVKARYKKKYEDLQRKKSELNSFDENLEDYLQFGVSFFEQLDKFYKSASVEIKQKMISSIFPEKLIFNDGNYRTPNDDSIIALITCNNRHLKSNEKEKAIKNDGSFLVAPVPGLEPGTRGLTVRCSNQLSYPGIFYII